MGMNQVGVIDVADIQVDRQTIPRQANPAAWQVFAQLLVLHGVEAVLRADPLRVLIPAGRRRVLRAVGSRGRGD